MTKLIRKAFQGTIPENKILDTYSASNTEREKARQTIRDNKD